MSMEEEKHVSQASAAEINISKFVFIVVHLIIPLIVGKFFGIVAERFAYGLVICIISLKAIEAFLVLDGIQVMVEKATEELERKMKDRDQAD